MGARLKPLILLSLPIIVSLALSYYLQVVILRDPSQVTHWLLSFGPFVVVIYVLTQIISVVVAPVGGFFVTVALIALYGPGFALILSYLVWTPSYLINFYLARRYGRPLVERLIGKEPLEKMDQFVEDEGLMTLIITRVFQAISFDYLAYGWGLTKIPFKTFAIVNFLGGIPATLIIYFVLKRFHNLTYGIIAFYLLTAALMGISFLLNKLLKRSLK